MQFLVTFVVVVIHKFPAVTKRQDLAFLLNKRMNYLNPWSNTVEFRDQTTGETSGHVTRRDDDGGYCAVDSR